MLVKETHLSVRRFYKKKIIFRIRCHVAEVERDRLGEYVGVVSDRAAKSESAAAEAASALREERRKTARLERALEKARVTIRDSAKGSNSNSDSSSSWKEEGGGGNAKRVAELEEELSAAREELERSRRRREDDLRRFMSAVAATRKALPEGARNVVESNSNNKRNV